MSIWRYIILVLCVVLSVNASASIYCTRAKDGGMSCSDTKTSGAKEIHLPKPQVISAPDHYPASLTREPIKPVKPAPIEYYVKITSPTPEFRYQGNVSEMINVGVSVTPKLPKGRGYMLKVIYDGKAREGLHTGSSILVDKVYRGEHTVQVLLVKESAPDTVVAESDKVKFFMDTPFIRRTPVRNRAP